MGLKWISRVLIVAASFVGLPHDQLSPVRDAQASYLCEAANDDLSGVFASTYPATGTLAAIVRVVTHPVAIDNYVSWGNSVDSVLHSYSIRATATVNQWAMVGIEDTTPTSALETQTKNDVWFELMGEIENDDSRWVYVDDFANSDQNTSNRAVNDALRYVKLCEGFDNNNDAEAKIAEVAIWDVPLSDANLTLYLTAQQAPTFTGAPTLGTETSTTLPVVFTSSHLGTVVGTACANGDAGNFAETEAGQCSGGDAAIDTFTQSVAGGVADGDTFTGLTPSTIYDLSFTLRRTNIIPTIDPTNLIGYWSLSTSSGTQSNSGVDAGGNLTVNGATFDSDHPNLTPAASLASIANATTEAGVGSNFSVAPSVTAQTTAQYTVGGTTSLSIEVDCVACTLNASLPTAGQVDAGNCAGPVAAEAHTSEVWNGANSMDVGGALTYPAFDLYCTDGTELVSLTDEFLDVPAGKQRLTLSSVHATSPYFPSEFLVAAGDICTVDLLTDPDGFTVVDEVDGTISFDSGGSVERQIVDSSCYDVTAPQNRLFTLVFNNLAPVPGAIETLEQIEVVKGVALTPIPLDTMVDDPEGDTVSVAAVTSLAPGLSISSDDLVGTPTTYGYTTTSMRWTDQYGSTYDDDIEVVVGFIMPDLTALAYPELQWMWDVINIFASADSDFEQAMGYD